MNLTLRWTDLVCDVFLLGSTVPSGVLKRRRGLFTASGDTLVSMAGSGISDLNLGDSEESTVSSGDSDLTRSLFNLNGDLLGTGGPS